MQDKARGVKQVYSQLDRKFEEQETQRRAASMHLPYFDLTGFPIDQTALAVIPKDAAEVAKALCFSKEGPRVRLGAVDPLHSEFKIILEDLQKNHYQTEVYLVSQSGFTSATQQYKKIIPLSAVAAHEVVVNTSPETLKLLRELSQAEEGVQKISATDLLNMIIGAAVLMNSSDIHIEPEKEFLKLRFRVDGVLQEMAALPLATLRLLLSRIKL